MISNKKGMTLLELLVSVVLISVIMLFMYKLISDVRSEKKENDKLTTNLVKISEIEAKLQKIIIDYNLNKVGYGRDVDSKYMVFGIKSSVAVHYVAWLYFFEGGAIELKVDSTLSGIENETVKWSLEGLELQNVCYEVSENKNILNYKVYLSDNNLIEIPLHNADEVYYSGTECPDEE